MIHRLIKRLADQAQAASAASLAFTAFCSIVLLMIPVLYGFFILRPSVMYERFLGAQIESLALEGASISSYLDITEDGDGFVSHAVLREVASIHPVEDGVVLAVGVDAAYGDEYPSRLLITPEKVIFAHNALLLEVSITDMPAWALRQGDWAEVIDRLALQNGYFLRFFLPLALLVAAAISLTLISLTGMLAGLLGLGRKLTHSLSFAQRIRVCCACSWLCALPMMLLGFVLPVMHVILYEMLLMLLAWHTQKRL